MGPVHREADRGALARLLPEGDLAGDVRDEHCLHARSAQLRQREPEGERREQEPEGEPREP